MVSFFFAASGATVCPKTGELTANIKKAKSATAPIRRDPVAYEIDDTWFWLFIGGVLDYFEFLRLKPELNVLIIAPITTADSPANKKGEPAEVLL